MIRSPADYMAEWESRPLDTKTTKSLVKHDPRRPMAAQLITITIAVTLRALHLAGSGPIFVAVHNLSVSINLTQRNVTCLMECHRALF